MPALLSMFGGAWPTILGLLVGAAGIVFGMFKHQQAKATKAESDKALAENKESAAQSNAEAALAGANSTKERIDVENTIAVQPAGTSAQRLRDEWSRD